MRIKQQLQFHGLQPTKTSSRGSFSNCYLGHSSPCSKHFPIRTPWTQSDLEIIRIKEKRSEREWGMLISCYYSYDWPSVERETNVFLVLLKTLLQQRKRCMLMDVRRAHHARAHRSKLAVLRSRCNSCQSSVHTRAAQISNLLVSLLPTLLLRLRAPKSQLQVWLHDSDYLCTCA